MIIPLAVVVSATAGSTSTLSANGFIDTLLIVNNILVY
jgi:hypothetical protein